MRAIRRETVAAVAIVALAAVIALTSYRAAKKQDEEERGHHDAARSGSVVDACADAPDRRSHGRWIPASASVRS